MVATSTEGARFKRSLAQSTYITTAWNWFLTQTGKAAEPVLVVSVLYTSVRLLLIVHFSPQWDVVLFQQRLKIDFPEPVFGHLTFSQGAWWFWQYN